MKCFFPKLLLCGLGIVLFGVPAGAQVGWGVVADGRGQFYFCDIERDRVWKLDQQTRLQLLLTQNHCHMLVGGWDGHIYGEDIGAEGRDANGGVSLWRLAADGTQSFVLPPVKNPDVAIGIVRDREGNTYQWHGDVQEKKFSCILKRAPDGRVTLLAGSEWGYADGRGAEARFTSVGGMAAGPDGALYVADERHLRKVTPDGAVTTLERKLFSGITGGLPNLSGLFNRNLGVTVDEEGNVYVVDLGARRVLRRTPQGVVSIVAESGGIANALTGGAWGWRPTGITRTGDNLYLMESWPHHHRRCCRQPTSAPRDGNPPRRIDPRRGVLVSPEVDSPVRSYLEVLTVSRGASGISAPASLSQDLSRSDTACVADIPRTSVSNCAAFAVRASTRRIEALPTPIFASAGDDRFQGLARKGFGGGPEAPEEPEPQTQVPSQDSGAKVGAARPQGGIAIPSHSRASNREPARCALRECQTRRQLR